MFMMAIGKVHSPQEFKTGEGPARELARVRKLREWEDLGVLESIDYLRP